MSDIRSLEQKRQEALDKANRLKKQIEKKLNGQKFVLGGMLMAIAEHEPDRIPQILADIDKYVTRKADISRLEGFKNSLDNKPKKTNIQTDEHMENFKKLITTNNKLDDLNDPDEDIPF